jgi:lysophospholipase L1-like esterase
MFLNRFASVVLASCTFFTTAPLLAADPILQAGDKVAICGDSITEQKMYSVFIEEYLLACQPQANLSTVQFGWGGETVWGFFGRVKNDVLGFKPTVATTCYGMNDGGYLPLKPEIAELYKKTTTDLVATLKEGGVRSIVIGSPGVVDSETYKRNGGAEVYNKTLGELRDIGKQVAADTGVGFADVHGAMLDAMTKFKATNPGIPFAGGDGVHPGSNGHLVMAYAFIKALGADGNIGTITVDLAGNTTTATDGHKVVSAANGVVQIESTRWPFIVPGDAKDPKTARGALPYVPFNEDLNRFMLVVPGGNGKMKVTWGEQSKDFDAAALAAGINLAAEFPDNPFGPAFAKLDAAVKAKQNFETPAVKQLINSAPTYKNMLPDQADKIDALVQAAIARQQQLSDAAAANLTPVTHTIKVEAVQ